jgi:hypothetical protein
LIATIFSRQELFRHILQFIASQTREAVASPHPLSGDLYVSNPAVDRVDMATDLHLSLLKAVAASDNRSLSSTESAHIGDISIAITPCPAAKNRPKMHSISICA